MGYLKIYNEQKKKQNNIKHILNSPEAEYNKLLTRYEKAEAFLNNPDIPESDKEKELPRYKTLLESLNAVLWTVQRSGAKPGGIINAN